MRFGEREKTSETGTKSLNRKAHPLETARKAQQSFQQWIHRAPTFRSFTFDFCPHTSSQLSVSRSMDLMPKCCHQTLLQAPRPVYLFKTFRVSNFRIRLCTKVDEKRDTNKLWITENFATFLFSASHRWRRQRRRKGNDDDVSVRDPWRTENSQSYTKAG